jgi:hypothetical protein
MRSGALTNERTVEVDPVPPWKALENADSVLCSKSP